MPADKERFTVFVGIGKGNFVRVHAMEAYVEVGSIYPLILNLGIRWR